MSEENNPKSIEKRLYELERWQKYNAENIQKDFMNSRVDYMDAPGDYVPNINQERYIENVNRVHTTDDMRIDMGGDKFNNKILNEDFIDELIEDTMLVEQDPENTKLESEAEIVSSLRDMATLIKVCEKYIKNNPRTHQSFVDAVKMLKMQYEEAISHLGQIRRLPAGDFLTSEAQRLWNLRNFMKSIKETDSLAHDLIWDFEDITSDFLDLG